MYHHSLLFVIISNNSQIETILRGITPLEDCDYTFCTVSNRQAAPAGTKRPDTAFIYDFIDGNAVPLEELAQDGEVILAADRQSPLFMDPAVLQAVSEFWMMPMEGAYEETLLQTYFQRLAKRMKEHADTRKQEICFDTLINSVPDISWFKDIDGAHLLVNDSFCRLVDKTREKIYKQGHCYIWDASKEDEEVCLASDRIIMDSRKTNTFEEIIKTRTDTLLLKSYKSALIDVDGTIFGTCGIAHDITALRNMNTELDMVLDSVPYAVLVENMQGVVLNKNSQFNKYFPQYIDIVGKPSDQWRQSLSKRLLLDEQIKEVIIVHPGEEEQVLVFNDEPILDNDRRNVGRIVTLTDITLERNILQKSEYMANTDYLTGLNNRRNLMRHLENVYDRDDLTLIMMDLDNFKQVNDTYGHDAGDHALKLTAENLKECFREDFITRMGGDEFMVVSCGKKFDEIKRGAEQMLLMTRGIGTQHKEFSGMTASIGIVPVAAFPKEKRNISDLLQAVDKLLYEAKRSGKNRCCIYGQ